MALTKTLSKTNTLSTDPTTGTSVAPSTGQNPLTGMWHLSGYGVDKTGATDMSATLQTLVNAVSAAGGGVIWADDGTYKWSSTVVWKSKVSLGGNHKSTVKFMGYTVDTPLIRYSEASDSASAAAPLTDVTFSGFTIDGTNQTCTGGVYNVATKGIFIQHMRRVSFRDLYVTATAATGLGCDFAYEAVDFTGNEVIGCGRLNSGTQPGGSGIGIGSAATTDDEPVTVTGNYCSGNKRYGIFVESQNSPAFTTLTSGGRIVNNVCRSNAVGIGDSGNWRLLISDNDVFLNTSAGISVDIGTYSSGRTGYHGTISNNQVYKNTGPGVKFDYSGTSTNTFPGQYMCRDNEISNNTGEGILIGMDTVNVNAVHLLDNNVYKNTLSGIRIDYTGATKTAVLGNAEIRGNICDNNGTAATAGNRDGFRIQVPLSNIDLRHNRCYDYQGTKTQGYGLAVGTAAATIAGGSISDNDFRNNLTGATIFTNSPTGVHVARNLGSTPPAPQSVTPGASPWTYTAPDFTTYLSLTGGTVSAVTVGGVTVAASSERVLPLEPGDSVVVTYSSAPTVLTRAR